MDFKPLSITELTQRLKSLIEGEFPDIWVTGEISNFHHHSSGHMYFTLKDHRAEIKCTYFRGYNQYLKFKLEEGMQVITSGAISVYEKRGQYQLSVRQMEPAGVGTLYLAFEALKKQLQAEGLFDAQYKKPLPKFSRKIGVVSSGTSAALRDIIQVLGRRAPHIELVVRPTKVQGQGAAEDIVKGIEAFQNISEVDLLIVGRGGGSLEDLWAFNEEIVARAIFASEIPIISAVGHEVDMSISDLVADLRAPTPSAGAELASLQSIEIMDLAQNGLHEIRLKLQGQILENWQNLDSLEHRLNFQAPSEKIKQNQEKMHQLFHQMQYAIETKQKALQANLFGFEKHLISLSPESILHRGYALATLENGMLIRSQEDVETGEHFTLQTGKGRFEAKKIRNKERK